MDPLSELCASLRVQHAVFTRVEASAPWGVATPGGTGVKFVLVVRGSSILTLPTLEAPVALRGGDVFITLGNVPHHVYDDPTSILLDCQDVLARKVGDTITVGGGGPVTTFISGAFEIEQSDALPLFSVLPPVLLLRAEEERSRSFESVLEMLARETGRQAMGSQAMTTRLFEVLFIQAIRAYADQSEHPKRGWLAALSDRQLRGVVRAMHEDLAHDWSLEELAKQAGMSRSAFSARFKQTVGQTPLDYLAQWRMLRASQLIHHPELSLAEIARTVGYQSVAAFNRMFKREIGTTPGRFRKVSD